MRERLASEHLRGGNSAAQGLRLSLDESPRIIDSVHFQPVGKCRWVNDTTVLAYGGPDEGSMAIEKREMVEDSGRDNEGKK